MYVMKGGLEKPLDIPIRKSKGVEFSLVDIA